MVAKHSLNHLVYQSMTHFESPCPLLSNSTTVLFHPTSFNIPFHIYTVNISNISNIIPDRSWHTSFWYNICPEHFTGIETISYRPPTVNLAPRRCFGSITFSLSTFVLSYQKVVTFLRSQKVGIVFVSILMDLVKMRGNKRQDETKATYSVTNTWWRAFPVQSSLPDNVTWPM